MTMTNRHVAFLFGDDSFLFRWREVEVWKNHGDLLCCRARKKVMCWAGVDLEVLVCALLGGCWARVDLELPASWAPQPDGRWTRKRVRRQCTLRSLVTPGPGVPWRSLG